MESSGVPGELRAPGKKIGVYVCWCGGNISDVVDVAKVVEVIKNEPGVVVARHFMFMCSDAGQKMIESDVKRYGLDAVVVASCSPKLHELTFRGTVKRAGMNEYMYYHANIREQVSWPHSNNPVEATKKAIRHIRMAVAYARLAEPLEKIKVSSEPRVLIIGGGVAGLRAALDLSSMGVEVYLIEKGPFLGGRVAQLSTTYPYGRRGYEIVGSLVEELVKRDNVKIFTNSEVVEVKGFVGNFEVRVRVNPRYVKPGCPRLSEAIEACPVEVPDEFNYGMTKRKALVAPPYPGAYPPTPYIDMERCTRCGECLKICGSHIDLDEQPKYFTVTVGSILVMTGFRPYEPRKGEFGYKEFGNVLTLQQFMRLLDLNKGDKMVVNGREVRDIAFIYCVGSRQKPTGEGPVNEYCSRYCCNAVMHLSIELMKRFPGLRLYHLYRDIRTYGKNELMYERAGRMGSIFIKYDVWDPPKILGEGDKLVVKTKDLLTDGEVVEIPVDLVVLVTGMVPNKNEALNNILKLPIGRDGFYQEVHPKLRPVETTLSGLLIGGTAQGPKDIRETLASASAAAAKAATIVLKGKLELEPFVAHVDPAKCELSKKCISECPANAIEIRDYEGLGARAWVNEALCKGCGACVAVCPTEAIQLKGLTNRQIVEMIRAGGREVSL